MPPEALTSPDSLASHWPRLTRWQTALTAVSISWLVLILLFGRTWGEMAGQWWSSSTYSHILLIPAILVWLVQIRAPQLALLSPLAWWPGLALLAGALFVWLVGTLADVSIASQSGAVTMLVAAVLTLLGPKVGAALAFPLGYMMFLVPVGDELVPAMQLVTATLTVALIELSAIPASVDGVFIDTPAGLFEVAEACSGVKFLVAMAAFGVLVANVCFRSWSLRVAFLFLALALPILANGVRAWGTILVAQWIGAERATGFDHIVYGWIFFAVVIAAVLAMSWRFFDRAANDPMIDAEAIAASPLLTRLERLTLPTGFAVVLIAGLASAVIAWAAVANRLAAAVPERVQALEVAGWNQVAYRPAAPWSPRASGAERRLLTRYRNAAGAEVDLFFAFYARQGEGSDAGGFGEGALTPDSGWAWLAPGPNLPEANVHRLLGPNRVERLAATTYRTGELASGSNLRLKLATVGNRLGLRSRPTMVLILSAEQRPGHDAVESLRAFRASAGPVGPWMDRIAGLR